MQASVQQRLYRDVYKVYAVTSWRAHAAQASCDVCSTLQGAYLHTPPPSRSVGSSGRPCWAVCGQAVVHMVAACCTGQPSAQAAWSALCTCCHSAVAPSVALQAAITKMQHQQPHDKIIDATATEALCCRSQAWHCLQQVTVAKAHSGTDRSTPYKLAVQPPILPANKTALSNTPAVAARFAACFCRLWHSPSMVFCMLTMHASTACWNTAALTARASVLLMLRKDSMCCASSAARRENLQPSGSRAADRSVSAHIARTSYAGC